MPLPVVWQLAISVISLLGGLYQYYQPSTILHIPLTISQTATFLTDNLAAAPLATTADAIVPHHTVVQSVGSTPFVEFHCSSLNSGPIRTRCSYEPVQSELPVAAVRRAKAQHAFSPFQLLETAPKHYHCIGGRSISGASNSLASFIRRQARPWLLDLCLLLSSWDLALLGLLTLLYKYRRRMLAGLSRLLYHTDVFDRLHLRPLILTASTKFSLQHGDSRTDDLSALQFPVSNAGPDIVLAGVQTETTEKYPTEELPEIFAGQFVETSVRKNPHSAISLDPNATADIHPQIKSLEWLEEQYNWLHPGQQEALADFTHGDTVTGSSQRLKSLEQQKCEQQRESERQQQRINELEAVITTQQDTIVEQQNAIATQQDTIVEQQNANATQQDTIVEQQNANATQQSIIADLEEHNGSLEERIQQEQGVQQMAIKQLNEHLEMFGRDAGQPAWNVRELQTRLSSHANLVSTMSTWFIEQIGTSNELLQENEARKQRAEKELQDTESKIQTYKASNDDLLAQIDDHARNREASKNLEKTLKREVTTARRDMEAFKNEVKKLETRLASVDVAQPKTEMDPEQLQKDNKGLRAMLNQLQQDCDEQDNRISSIRTENDTLCLQLRERNARLIWRIVQNRQHEHKVQEENERLCRRDKLMQNDLREARRGRRRAEARVCKMLECQKAKRDANRTLRENLQQSEAQQRLYEQEAQSNLHHLKVNRDANVTADVLASMSVGGKPEEEDESMKDAEGNAQPEVAQPRSETSSESDQGYQAPSSSPEVLMEDSTAPASIPSSGSGSQLATDALASKDEEMYDTEQGESVPGAASFSCSPIPANPEAITTSMGPDQEMGEVEPEIPIPGLGGVYPPSSNNRPAFGVATNSDVPSSAAFRQAESSPQQPVMDQPMNNMDYMSPQVPALAAVAQFSANPSNAPFTNTQQYGETAARGTTLSLVKFIFAPYLLPQTLQDPIWSRIEQLLHLASLMDSFSRGAGLRSVNSSRGVPTSQYGSGWAKTRHNRSPFPLHTNWSSKVLAASTIHKRPQKSKPRAARRNLAQREAGAKDEAEWAQQAAAARGHAEKLYEEAKKSYPTRAAEAVRLQPVQESSKDATASTATRSPEESRKVDAANAESAKPPPSVWPAPLLSYVEQLAEEARRHVDAAQQQAAVEMAKARMGESGGVPKRNRPLEDEEKAAKKNTVRID